MRLLQLHRTYLLRSATMLGILAREIRAREQAQQIAEIGRMNSTRAGPTPSPQSPAGPGADEAEAGVLPCP